jgi:hypothetical protein
VYESPYNHRRPYAGQYPLDERCPICGQLGDCLDAAPVDMPLPPFTLDDIPASDSGGSLRSYDVTVNGFVTRMQLNSADAAHYSTDAAQTLSEVPYVE